MKDRLKVLAMIILFPLAIPFVALGMLFYKQEKK